MRAVRIVAVAAAVAGTAAHLSDRTRERLLRMGASHAVAVKASMQVLLAGVVTAELMRRAQLKLAVADKQDKEPIDE